MTSDARKIHFKSFVRCEFLWVNFHQNTDFLKACMQIMFEKKKTSIHKNAQFCAIKEK